MPDQHSGPGRRTLGVLAGAVALLLVIANILWQAHASLGFYWEDDYTHLLISRYAISHPVAVLNIWGRPIMTLAYMPVSMAGPGLVRVLSLLMLGGAAALVALTARRLSLQLPVFAAVLVLAQPVSAEVGFGALPQTVFSLLTAGAFFLRARDRAVAAAAVVSFLPLARLEGLVVIVAWAGASALQKRWRELPPLAIGMALWAGTAAAVYHDPLWLLHRNPYGVLGSFYPAAGWGYMLRQLPGAAGLFVVALALVALARRRLAEPLAVAVTAGLAAFYMLSWGLPAFNSFKTPVYLATLAVPLALVAQQGLDHLARPGRRFLPGELAALALAVLTGSLRLMVVVLLLLALGRARDALRADRPARLLASALRPAAVIAGLAAALSGGLATHPLPLDGLHLLAYQLRQDAGGRASMVRAGSEPTFEYVGNLDTIAEGMVDNHTYRDQLAAVPVGSYAVWDSQIGGSVVSERQLREMGFVLIAQRHDPQERISLWLRQSPPSTSATWGRSSSPAISLR